ncbi:hypothetical protein ACELLULO517_04665 [Acidisoma cellulosilytica]|uniref:Uncharacterized protein n=1 Tax=Acidisoma cellulosilyticum TaxID=2802395 RepID=A0A963Z0D8_9PROT|nr:hypothetical protein [Acidisoma cellulosilyticum]MCB8879515.1 hypothetical protein [Acidisoma cellulosilyticum]
MSETAPEHDLDIREQIVRIDRALAESRKFQAEQQKLIAEAAKYERERSLAPLVIAASLGAGIIAGVVSLLGRFIP